MFDLQQLLFVLMSKTRENLNVLNLACEMEYLLRKNDASEPDWAVKFCMIKPIKSMMK